MIFCGVKPKFAILFLAALSPVGIFDSAAFSQSITLAPAGGPPGTSTQVSGTGFSAGASIDLFFDNADEAPAIADGSGAFSNVAIPVPSSALPGPHTVKAALHGSGSSAEQTFAVYTEWRQGGFSPLLSGFNPFENILSPANAGSLALQWKLAPGGALEGPPTLVNGIVYVSDSRKFVYALNSETGATLWTFHAGQAVIGSPAVANGVVYFGSEDGMVYALNARTGAKIWTFATSQAIVDHPTLTTGAVYIASTNGIFYALDPATGTKLWSFTTGADYTWHAAVANGVVYLPPGDNNLYALDATSGAILWTFSTGVPINHPMVANGTVYVDSQNTYYALDANTAAVLWTHAEGAHPGGLLGAGNGVVYCGTNDGYIQALRASTGAALWSTRLVSSTPLSPLTYSDAAIANGVLYLSANNGNIYAFNAQTGSRLWTYETRGNPNFGGPTGVIVANGKVLAASAQTFDVYSFRLPGSAAER
jgi:outer membrane protein assembly factor BamB